MIQFYCARKIAITLMQDDARTLSHAEYM